MAGNTSDVFPKKFCLRDGVERLKIVAWARIPEQSMKVRSLWLKPLAQAALVQV